MCDDQLDLYTEPDADVDTLKNLGPLAPMAGEFEGAHGADVHPGQSGDEPDAFVERYQLDPIDPQTNGPQLLYGLRYHQHVRKPGEVGAFHDQVGFWLWEPATETVTLSIAIPRAQVVLASGHATSDTDTFSLEAHRGSTTHGIVSGPFLDTHFLTDSYSITVRILGPDSWRYEEFALMQITGRSAPVRHSDSSTLTRVAAPVPNPLANLATRP